MYLNFHKYNYSLVPDADKSDYEERDKIAYKEVLNTWFNDNIESFVSRKWEIEEIHYLKQIGAFIKLLREAEQLYELGFFTSCIALIGVSAEDFSKYISLLAGKTGHITTTKRSGRTIDVSQNNRLQFQLDENLITQSNYNLLDEIRSIRNDCLHYNQNFKQKLTPQLKLDAIKVLNNLKIVLKDIIGSGVDANDYKILLDESFKQESARNFEEIVWKHRNMFSHLLNIPIAQNPNVKIVTKYNFYEVTNLDEDEIELTELNEYPLYETRLFVLVDIDERGRQQIENQQISKGDTIFAKIFSNVDSQGSTSFWYIETLKKI